MVLDRVRPLAWRPRGAACACARGPLSRSGTVDAGCSVSALALLALRCLRPPREPRRRFGFGSCCSAATGGIVAGVVVFPEEEPRCRRPPRLPR